MASRRLACASAADTRSGRPRPRAAAQDAAEAAGPLQEIVVTATRHEESLSKVPISVTALTQDAMDVRGIKDILDVARFTPGINIDNSGTNNIAIRGIASTGGAGTTGIYLDDTPIQIRALAFNPDDALPQVLRHRSRRGAARPAGHAVRRRLRRRHGALHHHSAEPDPDQRLQPRTKSPTPQGGVPSYEAGAAAGTPLIDGKLGVRVTRLVPLRRRLHQSASIR